MDSSSIETLRNNVQTTSPEVDVSGYLDALQRYVETGEPYFVHIPNRDEFEAFLQLLGIQEVDGAQVIHTRYSNTASYFYEDDDEADYTGTAAMQTLMEHLADQHALFVEFVNNFKVTITVGLDETTAVIIEYECDEQPGICEDCRNDDEYMKLNKDYSCEHGVDDDYTYWYRAIILDIDDLHKVRLGSFLFF